MLFFMLIIVITASTVNELLQLVVNNQVDAALVWKDMLKWDIAKELTEITIPDSLNRPKKIFVSTLSTTTDSWCTKSLFSLKNH